MEQAQVEEMLSSVTKEKEALSALVKEMDERSKKYEGLGTPEELEEALDLGLKMKETLEAYRKIAKTPEEMAEALEGGIATINSLRDQLEAYKNLGTPEDIEEAFEASKQVIVESRARDIASSRNIKLETVINMFDKVNDFAVVEELLSAGTSVNEDDDAGDDDPKKDDPAGKEGGDDPKKDEGFVVDESGKQMSKASAFLKKNHKNL